MPSKEKKQQSFTQADGLVEVVTPSWHDSSCQVSWKTDSTTGTVAVYAKYHPDADMEAVLDEDGVTPLVIDFSDTATVKTFQLFDKWVYSLYFDPTGVDATYTPLIASGEVYRTYA